MAGLEKDNEDEKTCAQMPVRNGKKQFGKTGVYFVAW